MPFNVFLSHIPTRHYLYEWREKRELSQVEIGKILGVSGAAIAHYEKGDRPLTDDLMFKLFKHLDILPGQFFAPPETPSLDAQANFMTAHELGHLLLAVETVAKLPPEKRMALLLEIRQAAERAELSPQSPQSTPGEAVE